MQLTLALPGRVLLLQRHHPLHDINLLLEVLVVGEAFCDDCEAVQEVRKHACVSK